MSAKYTKKRFFVLGALFIVALLVAGAFWATQQMRERAVTICPDGCDFAKIAEALAARSSRSTFVLRPGTYAESLTIDKALYLFGEDPDKTVIAGEITVLNTQDVRLYNIAVKGQLRIRTSNGIRLEKTHIIESPSVGLAISDSRTISVRESHITGHKADGVTIVNSNVELQSNLIGGNSLCGIRADAASQVLGSNNQSGGARVPQDFQTIQEAIDGWKEGLGPNRAGNLCGPLAPELLTGTGAIVIAPGIYRERLMIRDRAIYLHGAGIDETVLDGSGLGENDGITLRGQAQLTLDGVTVQNFRDDGLDAEGPINLIISKSAFIANKSNGLEIAHDLVRMSLHQSIVRDNSNYGLWVLNAENISECRENVISNNGTNFGGLSNDITATVARSCQGEP